MKRACWIMMIGGLLALFYGCNMAGAPILQLGTPRFVAMSQPDSVEETGIGQDPMTGGIFLQWYSTLGAARYKVFRSDSLDEKGLPTDFMIVADVISSSALNDTSIVDVNSIETGVRYYYYLRVYASDGSQSVPSDTINYALLPRPTLSYPGINATVDKAGLYFGWHDLTGGGSTVIRVEDISVVPARYVWVSGRFQIFESYPTKEFDFDSTAIAQLITGHSYQWRVDRFIPGANEGARSNWQTFTVQ